MAVSRNALIAHWLMLRASLTLQRPTDCLRKLRARLTGLATSESINTVPQLAWRAYKEWATDRSFCTNGWLVEYGVYSFRGPREFSLSLGRQFNTLEPMDDGLIQLRIVLYHDPTPELEELGGWNQWSFKYPSVHEFFDGVQTEPGMRQLLASTSDGWKLELEGGPT